MPRTLTDSELKKRQRLALDRTANFILGATVIFALVGGLLLFPASPVFVPLLISLAAVSLAFKWFANPPVTLGRSFLYVAGAAMSVALLATLLTFPPTLGLVIGLTAMVAMSFAIGARFLEKPHSLATDLNPMSKAGYFTMALAFVGLATVFSLMAAGVVPTFIVLPVMAGAAVGAALLTSLITLCTHAKAPLVEGVDAASNAHYVPGASLSAFNPGVSTAQMPHAAATQYTRIKNDGADEESFVETTKYQPPGVQIPV